jgi:hippurate hydrolase
VALKVIDDSFVQELDLRMTAEDFAFYSHLVPVCFFRLGVGNKVKGITYNVHHPKFDIDERSMKTGLLLFSSIALSTIN